MKLSPVRWGAPSVLHYFHHHVRNAGQTDDNSQDSSESIHIHARADAVLSEKAFSLNLVISTAFVRSLPG